jgi:hypothetical protein
VSSDASPVARSNDATWQADRGRYMALAARCSKKGTRRAGFDHSGARQYRPPG